MKDIIIAFLCLLPCIVCMVGAILMAINGVHGWGWVLFVGLAVTPSNLPIN